MALRNITNVVDEINLNIQANLSYSNNRFYSVCVQHTKNEKGIIITREGNSTVGELVSPNNLRNIIFYHRIIEQEVSELPIGKGNQLYQHSVTTMRMVAIGRRRDIPKNNQYWDNQDFAEEVVSIYNQKRRLTNKEGINVLGYNSNMAEILDEELPGQNWQKLKMELVVFTIDYTIRKLITCD